MAVIKPFRGWRYASRLSKDIGKLISPPFDVVSSKQRAALYQEPLNSIHLSVPDSENPAQSAARTLDCWKREGILQQESEPAIYVYYQYFKLPGSATPYCRKGFIVMIEASYWKDRVVLRHEDTIPGSVNDRVDLLAATQLNASPTHGLYTDPEHQLELLMDQSMENILYQAEDYQGVRDLLAVITDPDTIRKFVVTLRDKQVILADGHHRYESSLIYRQRQSERDSRPSGGEGYKYHLMYLTNTESEDLRILPTHRLIAQSNFSSQDILERVARYFTIKPVENASDIPEIIAGKLWAFGLMFDEESYKLRLKPDLLETIDWNLPPEVQALDTVVLHYFLVEKVLGIGKARQARSPVIFYERSFANCIYRISKKEVQMALITNGVTIEEVKQACYSGHLMPQKSTYFYPKAICGFVFGSIRDDEL